MFLTVTDLTGISEPLYDVKTPKRIEEVNGDYSLSFLIFNSDRNVHAYPLVKEESLIEYKDVEYRIKNVVEQNIGERSMKTITAQHTMFDLIDHYVYGTLTGTKTFTQALDFLFNGTGYTYTITDIFPSEDVGEEFGNDNSLSLFQKSLEIYQAEYEIEGSHFTFRQQIGNQTDTQFRYKHNIKAINKSSDSSGISTYIKGYGKLKEEKDVLSGNSIPYSSRSGTYYTEPGLNQLATEKVGANFKFSFSGTGFNFKTIVTFLGGVWEFTIDGSQSVKISTYEDVTSKDKTFEIIRGLENKTHSVVATFKGKDSKNPYTKLKSDPAPIVYLKSGNIIGLYRELVGDEQYTVTAEYISPNASKFPNPFSEDGYKHAEPVYDERVTSKTTLLNKLKKTIQDEPELSLTVDFVDLRNAGYPYQHPNKGDEILLIYEPMNLDMDVRIMRIEEEEDSNGNIVNCAVTLANFGNSASSVMTSFSQTTKRISRILTDDDKLKFDFLDEAVKRATAALQSAQTELEFNNGIIAREKTNPNEIVLFNSQGVGISTDGGQTFRTAMTAEGFVADAITTGTLRAIIIEGVEIIGSIIRSADEGTEFYVEGGNMILSRNGRKVTVNPDGIYGINSVGGTTFQADRSLVTSAALGTSNTNVYLATDWEARVVDLNTIPSDGSAENYNYKPIRALGLRFAPGANGYIGTSGELRITDTQFAEGSDTVYRNLRASTIFGTSFITTTTNAYIGTDDELRVVNKGLSGIYRNVRANGYFGTFLTADPDLYAYIGTDLGLRVTSRGLASAGPVYRDVTAASFSNGSRIESKSDIVLWKEDALSIICESNLASYFLNGDIEQGREIRKYGLVIGGEWKTPEQIINGDGIDQYAMTTFSWRGLQQVNETLKTHDTKIQSLTETVETQAAEIQSLSETVETQQLQLTDFAALTESLTSRLAELEARVAKLEAL
ncbi:phage tail spike protein [Peribacillus simplex]|uniref:phage tail spike protein n=1 Tax=Peribacillus simplex TaxID=1478 RepID=UPI00333C1AC3